MTRSFYSAGIVDAAAHFVIDRAAWHAKVAEDLLSGDFLLLHAPRQSGKSSAAAAVATMLESSGEFVSISCTMDNLHVATVAEMWRCIECGIYFALVSLAVSADGGGASITALKTAARPLFTDAESFKALFAAERWGAVRVILILDEFDKLLDAAHELRDDLLGALRALRTQQKLTAGRHARPFALHAVLGIGVYRLVHLAAHDSGSSSSNSPFNISRVIQVPRTTLRDVDTLFKEVGIELGVRVPQSIVNDVYWRSGGHVGLISILGQQMLELVQPGHAAWELDDALWAERVGGSHFLGVLRHSSSVLSMLRSVGELRGSSHEEAAEARVLLRTMLSAPDGAELDVDGFVPGRRSALDYLLSEGIIMAGDIAHGSSTYRITAPMLAPLLMQQVGSCALVARLPKLAFPRRPDNSVDLIKSVLELLPYFSMSGLFHQFSLLKLGFPCKHAYHFQLFDLMSHRATDGGWHVLGETRNAAAAGPLRRLDLLVASNGTACGVDLLVEEDELHKHIYEQAPTYIAQQRLRNLLVVNFACQLAKIIPRVDTPLPPKVDVMQVYVDQATESMTAYTLDEEQRFVAQSSLRLLSPTGFEAHADAEALRSSVRCMTCTASGAPRNHLVSINAVDFVVKPGVAVKDLLARVAHAFGLRTVALTLVRVHKDGSCSQASDNESAHELFDLYMSLSSRVEVRGPGIETLRVSFNS